MAPSTIDYRSRAGYGANKVAAEHVLLDSGAPVTVLRAATVHGPGSPRPREWVFVRRVLDRRPAVILARRGEGVDHTTAAANVAALIEAVAAQPGRRVLNSADPDAPSGLEIARAIARHLDYQWDEVLLEPGAEPELGRHPWDAEYPIVLDMTAAAKLGYAPAGNYAHTVAAEVDWLVSIAAGDQDYSALPWLQDDYFDAMFDYAAEDRFLAARPGR